MTITVAVIVIAVALVLSIATAAAVADVATERWRDEARAECARLRGALPDLSHVISWLDAGCAPDKAAAELRIHRARIVSAVRAAEDADDAISRARHALTEPPTRAAIDVLAERRRQVEVEGWTPDHDDQHTLFEMASAAACYAYHASLSDDSRADMRGGYPSRWPWERNAWKPKDRRADLVRAGALILAEIERLDRDAQAEPEAT